MGSDISTAASRSSPRPCKIVIQFKEGASIATHVNDTNITWAQLCRRTIEVDGASRLLHLLEGVYPRVRLRAYRLRYDLGLATVVKPTWRDNCVEDAFVDVNASFKLSERNDGEVSPFAPHERIIASLGEAGAERTTFVDLHFEVIDGNVSPFPVVNEKTNFVLCDEYEDLPRCIRNYNLSETKKGEDINLPKTFANITGGVDGQSNNDLNYSSERGGREGNDQIDIHEAVAAGGSDEDNTQNDNNTYRENDAIANKADGMVTSIEVSSQKWKKAAQSKDSDDNTSSSSDSDSDSDTSEGNTHNEAAISHRGKKKVVTQSKFGTCDRSSDSSTGEGALTVRNVAVSSTTKKKVTQSNADTDSSSSSSDGSTSEEPVSVKAGVSSQKKGKILPSKSATPKKKRTASKRPIGAIAKTDADIKAKPANALPRGWTMRHLPRPNNPSQKDAYYYSPNLQYKFRSKAEVKLFCRKIEEADGDEGEAMELYGKLKKKKAMPQSKVPKKSSEGSDDQEKSSAPKPKKRRVEKNATKRALEEHASEPAGNESNGEGSQDQGPNAEGSLETKRKKQRKKKDPNQPKKPSNVYILWCKSARQKIKKDHPELLPKEVAFELGKRYKAATKDELKPFMEKFKADSAKYKADMEAYTQSMV